MSVNVNDFPCACQRRKSQEETDTPSNECSARPVTPLTQNGNRNVWSAALSQAKNETDRMVCANVFGLRWSTKLLAWMECAARSSYLVMQP